MKKLVAISVLLAVLAAAVFAQDDEGKWKVGFSAVYVTDMLFTTAAKADFKAVNGSTTTTGVFGDYNKGSTSFFGNTNQVPSLDNRLSVRFSNSGENYDVWADIALDNWANAFDGGMTIGQFLLNGKPSTDWYAKGTAGIFDAQIGTAGRGGFVSPFATWNNWLSWMEICKFGVFTAGGFIVSDEFRTQNEWGQIFAVGVALGDNYKLSLGYRLEPNYNGYFQSATDPWSSKSAINANFLLSGRPVEAVSFDLFYSVMGFDGDTLTPGSGGAWENVIGAFVGINGIDNLGLSLGYTVNFDVAEKGTYTPDGATDLALRSYTLPIYSGIDIRLTYSGIEKIGLTFNNNISLGSVKGEGDSTKPNATDTIIQGFDGTRLYDGNSDGWFHWASEIKASFALVENMDLTLGLANRLGVTTIERKVATDTTNTDKTTTEEFRASLVASTSVGSFTVGAGLYFSVAGKTLEQTNTKNDDSFTANTSVTKFGIPVFFKVAF